MNPPNRILQHQDVAGELAYVYGLKARAQRHHCLGYGTFTVDVEGLGALRRRYSQMVSPITYLPIWIKATALAIREHPEANTILFKKLFGHRLVRFEQVDVNIPITRELDGRQITFIATVRDAPNKSLSQIQRELTALQRSAADENFALERYRKLARVPSWLVRLIHWWMTVSPEFYVRNVGTCGVTTIGGDWYDFFLPIAPTSFVFGVGAIRREPVVRRDEVVARRVLRCSSMADNYAVSGLAGAEVARHFKEVIESGAVITDELDQMKQDTPLTGVARSG